MLTNKQDKKYSTYQNSQEVSNKLYGKKCNVKMRSKNFSRKIENDNYVF